MANTKGSDNPFPSLLIVEGTEPTAPSAGQQRLYIDSTTHKLKRTNSSGTDVDIEASSGLSDPMTSRGDIIVRNASNVTARLAKGSASQVLTSDGTDVAWATPTGGSGNLAGTELDYVAKTSSTSITATTEGTANTIVTGSSVAYNGSTIVLVEFFCPNVTTQATASAYVVGLLYEDSTVLGQLFAVRAAAAANVFFPVYAALRRTPSNASHTYTVKAYTSSGTATAEAGTGGTGAYVAAFVRVTRVSS